MSAGMPIGWGFVPDPSDAPCVPRDQSKAEHQHNRIAYWLGRLRYVPEVEEIINEWGVSRATAYRWHAFAASGGQLPAHPIKPSRKTA